MPDPKDIVIYENPPKPQRNRIFMASTYIGFPPDKANKCSKVKGLQGLHISPEEFEDMMNWGCDNTAKLIVELLEKKHVHDN